MLALGTVCQAPASITQTPKWLQTAHASSSRRTTRRGQRGPCASWSAGGRGGGSVLARASAVLTPEKQDAMQEHGPRGPTLSAATALPTSTLSPPPLRLSCSVFFQRQTHTSSPLQTFPGPRGEGMIFPPHLWVLPTLGHRTALVGEAPSAPSPAVFLPRAARRPSCVGPQA